MNTQTLILTVMIFWLIMGLAFLSAYSEVKRTGGTLVDAMHNNETFFFIISIVVGLVVVAFKLAGLRRLHSGQGLFPSGQFFSLPLDPIDPTP